MHKLFLAILTLSFTTPALASETRPQVDLTQEFRSVEYSVEYGIREAIIIVRAKQAPTIVTEAATGNPDCQVVSMRKTGPNYFIVVGIYNTDDGDGCTYHLSNNDDQTEADVTISTIGS